MVMRLILVPRALTVIAITIPILVAWAVGTAVGRSGRRTLRLFYYRFLITGCFSCRVLCLRPLSSGILATNIRTFGIWAFSGRAFLGRLGRSSLRLSGRLRLGIIQSKTFLDCLRDFGCTPL